MLLKINSRMYSRNLYEPLKVYPIPSSINILNVLTTITLPLSYILLIQLKIYCRENPVIHLKM